MAGIDVRMNYGTMAQMAKAFHAAHQQLHDTHQAVSKLGQQMEGGALQGEGGAAFKAAIDGPLVKAMKKLEAKMQELEKDIKSASKATQSGVKDATGRFNN
jgi:WXG100 family type VII secretion target